MVATIQQIIGKINPLLYAKNGKELLRKYQSAEKIPAEEISPKSLEEHKIVYDSSTETLEPVYFFILDLMNDFGLKPEKLIDNFSASPGSGHFGELGQRATIMQQQGTKILADINAVIRSVLNIVHDLKDFRIRLQSYDDIKSRDDYKRNGARQTLKQIWLDRVDVNRGQGSIHAMTSGQLNFVTLRDSFLVANSLKDAENLDLNDRVKRILISRVQEYNIWLDQSERELRKRYELEKTYLKSQVNSLKLYSRWAKPYLTAAHKLENQDKGRDPSMVNTFNTLLLELSLLGKNKINVQEAALEGTLPKDFKKLRTRRDYFSCVLVNFNFRGIPQVSRQSQTGSHYVFGGRVEISFSGYALNSDEIKKINIELDESDIGDAIRLIDDSTTNSLAELQGEINSFLDEESKTESKSSSDGGNPFLALLGFYNDKPEQKKKSKSKNFQLIKDDWIEKNHLRRLAKDNSKNTTFDLFDIYKKAHGMPSYT